MSKLRFQYGILDRSLLIDGRAIVAAANCDDETNTHAICVYNNEHLIFRLLVLSLARPLVNF